MDHKWLNQQNKGLKAHQSSMICSGDSKQGFGKKMFVFFSPLLIHVHEQGLLFIVYCLFAKNCTNQIKSNYLNSHGKEAQEKPPGL